MLMASFPLSVRLRPAHVSGPGLSGAPAPLSPAPLPGGGRRGRPAPCPGEHPARMRYERGAPARIRSGRTRLFPPLCFKLRAEPFKSPFFSFKIFLGKGKRGRRFPPPRISDSSALYPAVAPGEGRAGERRVGGGGGSPRCSPERRPRLPPVRSVRGRGGRGAPGLAPPRGWRAAAGLGGGAGPPVCGVFAVWAAG